MERISLEKGRLGRLRRSPCVLGEPDLLSQHRITTVSSFLTQKKNVDSSEHFISGLNFSTTAHFSFFVNQRIREWGRDSKHDTAFRMKLSMYDVNMPRIRPSEKWTSRSKSASLVPSKSKALGSTASPSRSAKKTTKGPISHLSSAACGPTTSTLPSSSTPTCTPTKSSPAS